MRENQFLLGAASGSVAAYFLNLLITHLRREKRWLGFSIATRKIVEKGHPDLFLRYRERAIERLHSHTVLLRNIGNRPLTNIPIRIESLGGGHILQHEVNPPRGAMFRPALEAENTLLIVADLLNPGEVCSIGLTVADSSDGDLAVTARGESLLCKQLPEVPGTVAGGDGGLKFWVLGVAGSVVVALAAFASAKLLVSPSPIFVSPLSPTQERPLFAIRVERVPDKASGLEWLRRDAPGATELFQYWNDGGGRIAIGSSPTKRDWVYVPAPRKEFEGFYRQLQHAGLGGIKLYEVLVPPTWSGNELDLHLYRWASACGVNREWIDGWSAFRPQRAAEPENDCRPGGRCIIISSGCRGDAFADVPTTR